MVAHMNLRGIILGAVLLTSTIVFAKTINPEGKQISAKSFLHKKAPPLVVEKWLSEKPNLEGKLVLIDFWATWCGPCRKAIPELNRLQKKFPDKLVVIGLSDEPEGMIRNMEGPKIEYYSAIDSKDTMSKAVGVTGIPHVLVLDPQGIVRWEGFPLSSTHPLKEQTIEILIKRHCKPVAKAASAAPVGK